MAETYALIYSLQPQCMVSFKQGANGSEDFAAPERASAGLHRFDSILPGRRAVSQQVAQRAWQKNKDKKIELCNTLQPHAWGYNKADNGKHRHADAVVGMLRNAWGTKANLLLNTGPLPDGSIPSEDVKTLREVGRRLRNSGGNA